MSTAGAFFPATRVTGVDGCRDGWIGVDLAGGGSVTVRAAASLDCLLADTAAQQVVGIDMPLGLLADGWRAADREARALLGPRRSSIFAIPPAPVWQAPTYAAANQRCRDLTGNGFSAQAWGLRRKLLEAAEYRLRWWAAPALDPGQLRHLGEELIYRADPAGAEDRERKRFERRHLSFGFTLQDAGTITGACGDTLSAEIIKTAVHAFGPPLGTGDTRTAAQRRMDGLTAACAAALDSGKAGTRHGAAPHLSILVDEQTLAGSTATTGPGPSGTGTPAPSGTGTTAATGAGTPGTGPPGAACSGTTGTGPASETQAGSAPAGTPPLPGPPPARTGYGAMLTARQVLALACRADLSVIRWRDGIPLDVGRRYRTETPAIRRALQARDHGCRFTGCGMPAPWSTAHHLRPWKDGGTTSLNDTALFCFVHHHYYIHLLGWTVSGDPNGTLHFTHPNGWPTLDTPLPSQTKPRAPLRRGHGHAPPP